MPVDTSFVPSLPPEVAVLALGGTVFLLILMLGWLIYLHSRIRRLTAGESGKNLEQIIQDMQTNTRSLHADNQELRSWLQNVDSRVASSVRAIETVRFNPFQGDGSGGDQSFATALIDESGNGVVLLGLYARDRVSIYAKPVNKFSSKHHLTDEERDAITRAQKRVGVRQ